MILRRQFMKLSSGAVRVACIADKVYVMALLQWSDGRGGYAGEEQQ